MACVAINIFRLPCVGVVHSPTTDLIGYRSDWLSVSYRFPGRVAVVVTSSRRRYAAP